MSDRNLSDLKYFKSSHSGEQGCVEVAFSEAIVAVRDSKNPGDKPLIFNPIEWSAFLDGVKDGEFDLK